jgi:hypothetical protein
MFILPSLHIKLEFFKNFDTRLDKNGAGVLYLKRKFSRVSDSKIKKGIFVGPKIRALIQDGKLEDLLIQIEKSAWMSFKSVVNFCLKKRKPQLPHNCG